MAMRSKLPIAVVVLFVFCAILLFRRGGELCQVISEPYHPVPLYLREIKTATDESNLILQNTLKDERNLLSKEFNLLRKKLGQQDCEKSEDKQTDEAGGWCRKSSREDGGEHMTDMPLVKALSKFFKNQAVGSFGDGPGAYKRELLKLKEVKSYDAYDGAPFCEETSEGRVKFMDLTIPQFGIPIYDWVISLEVAEHIPKDFEPIYIDNLSRHCKKGIVMSWAVPEQGGLAHINNRPLEYVIKLLKRYGFKHDANASKLLQDAASFQWLRENTNVFLRNSTGYLDTLEKWYT